MLNPYLVKNVLALYPLRVNYDIVLVVYHQLPTLPALASALPSFLPTVIQYHTFKHRLCKRGAGASVTRCCPLTALYSRSRVYILTILEERWWW